MEIVLAWTFNLALGVACLALGWGWLAPRLARPVRLLILALVALFSLLSLAVTSQMPHDYHMGDLLETEHGSIILGIEIWLAVAGLVAALAAVGRRRTQNAALFGVGLYLMGVGITVYWMLDGLSTLQGPLLLFTGASVALAAAARLMGWLRWQARSFGLALALAVVLAAEALRGPGGRGGGPAEVSHDVLPLLLIGALVFLLGAVRFLRFSGMVLARPLLYAAAGIVGTGLVLLLRGKGEWTSEPGAASTTLYGLPLTLLVVAVSLAMYDKPAVIPARTSSGFALPGKRRVARAWPVTAGLLVLLIIAALWHPSAEACVLTPYAAESSALTGSSTTIPSSPRADAPRGSPGVPQFDALCAHRTYGLSQIVYIAYPGCKWAQVDPSYPVAQASGTVQTISISSADSPWIHTSHDLNFDLSVDPASDWLVLGGSAPGALLHVEVESGGFPPAYRPSLGDRVTVAGRWVFDCGHNPATEIHPAAVIADEHDEWRADAPGVPQQSRVLRVWMNSAPGVVHVPLAPFHLHVGFPSTPIGKTPAVKVASGNPGDVQWSVNSGLNAAANILITPESAHGSAYFELLLGYKDAPPTPAPPTYTLVFDKLAVQDNLHKAARDTTGVPGFHLPALGFGGTGNWFMDITAGHDWRTILTGMPVVGGQTYSLASIPPVRIAAFGYARLPLAITGYAENDPSDGVELASGSVSGAPTFTVDAGRLADLCCAKEQSFTPGYGAWTLYYHLTEVAP